MTNYTKSFIYFWLIFPSIWSIALKSSFKCIDNVARVPGIDYVMKLAGGVIQNPDVVGVSAIECTILCLKRGIHSCSSYGYNPRTQECFTKNVNSALTGLLCGVSVEDARFFCRDQGNTYVAYGGQNMTLMECVCGGTVDTDWAIPAVLRYNCIDECKGQYPCSIQNGPLRTCQVCMGFPTSCTSKPYLSMPLDRTLCTPIY